MTWVEPKGMAFARARIAMEAAEIVIHAARKSPGRMKSKVPVDVRRIAAGVLGALRDP